MGEGWSTLLEGWPWFHGAGRYPISAYSEFMPPPRLGRTAYGGGDELLLNVEDRWGWPVTEHEEELELAPGLARMAQQLLERMEHLAAGRPAHGIPKADLADNPWWPDVLRGRAGALPHERFLLLLPLSLSRTQDDKGRIRWTLFGASEQGPGRAFWRSFFTAPGRARPADEILGTLRRLLQGAFGLPDSAPSDLRAAGLRILPDLPDPRFPEGSGAELPAAIEPLRLGADEPVGAIRYLLTFNPFTLLPAAIQSAYLAGALHLLPFPGSLVFWGMRRYRELQRSLPFAMQIPLQHLFERHEAPHGIRIPQSGWLHEHGPAARPADPDQPALRQHFKRTHRWTRVHRHEDELAVTEREDKVAHVLFSALPDDLRLYDKPMARNAQLWSHQFRLLLDGPQATRDELVRAAEALRAGGLFGYRFQYPAMRVGRHEVYWQRPLVAWRDAGSGAACLMSDAPLGYLTAYEAGAADPRRAVELWPRLLRRGPDLAAVALFRGSARPDRDRMNVRKLLDSRALLGGGGLRRSFARALLTAPKEETIQGWLAGLPQRATPSADGRALAQGLADGLADEPAPLPPSLTYGRTARRSFEVAYWKTIASLAERRYLTKNNADPMLGGPPEAAPADHGRDLDRLADHLLDHYRAVLRDATPGDDRVGDLPFQWRTEFDFAWMGGWLHNQSRAMHERNLIAVIPGRDRGQAMIMADHYDTAYMEDKYDRARGGDGSRLAAAGADDNHSATAAMMLAAPVFLELSRAGRLACDIWLVHLTGEEFPADCLGARHLCASLVEGGLQLRLAGGGHHDLSATRIRGVYLMDMIAHNNDRDRDLFQISPGRDRQSLWLAQEAQLAAEMWNAGAAQWNRRSSRRGRPRGARSADGRSLPKLARFPTLLGEVRPTYDPRSTLYNTDGQIFADAGVPVVLFMENYDINRSGYHDTHDTMANIDLDYGAALAAIVIESVARAAAHPSGAPASPEPAPLR
jgi:hypothetical protein